MAVALCYFTEFGKLRSNTTASICGGIYAPLYFVLCVRYRRKESSRSQSHLLTSFLSSSADEMVNVNFLRRHRKHTAKYKKEEKNKQSSSR